MPGVADDYVFVPAGAFTKQGDGTATITLTAGGSQIGPAPAPELRFDLDGVAVETFAVAGTAAQLETHTFAVTLPLRPPERR